MAPFWEGGISIQRDSAEAVRSEHAGLPGPGKRGSGGPCVCLLTPGTHQPAPEASPSGSALRLLVSETLTPRLPREEKVITDLRGGSGLFTGTHGRRLGPTGAPPGPPEAGAGAASLTAPDSSSFLLLKTFILRSHESLLLTSSRFSGPTHLLPPRGPGLCPPAPG